MKQVTPFVHGIIDYCFAALLLIAPFLLPYYNREGYILQTYVPCGIGAAYLVNSLMSDYPLSFSRRISLSTHITVERVLLVLLIVSPWLMDFAGFTWKPAVVLGSTGLLITVVTAGNYRENQFIIY